MSVDLFIERSNGASSPQEIFGLFDVEMRALGFNAGFSYSASPSSHARAYGLAPNALSTIHSSYAPQWCSHYVERRFLDRDPVVAAIGRREAPFAWNDLWGLSKAQAQFMDEARSDGGLRAGISVPIAIPNGRRFSINVAGDHVDAVDSPDVRSRVALMAVQAHIAFMSLVAPAVANDLSVTLTAREREVLLWAARGKSAEGTSDILNISARTVKFHRANAIANLGVSNLTVAVVKALRLSLINP